MEKNFKQFYENLQLTEGQKEDAKTKYEGVCACLDRHYYDSSYNENHKFLFGSYKTHTNTRPLDEMQDVDVLFKIPRSIYEKYQDNPSGLLQEIRGYLKDKYTTTEKISAWQKVVLVKFAENHHNVELLPALEQADDTFLIPNTKDGGSWESFDPRASVDAFNESNTNTNNYTRQLVRYLKAWVKNTSTLNYASYILMQDVIAYLKDYYVPNQRQDEMVRDFFKHMLSKNLSEGLKSHFETAKSRALKAVNYENEGKHIEASEEWRKIFGNQFPLSDKNEDKKSNAQTIASCPPRPWFI